MNVEIVLRRRFDMDGVRKLTLPILEERERKGRRENEREEEREEKRKRREEKEKDACWEIEMIEESIGTRLGVVILLSVKENVPCAL